MRARPLRTHGLEQRPIRFGRGAQARATGCPACLFYTSVCRAPRDRFFARMGADDTAAVQNFEEDEDNQAAGEDMASKAACPCNASCSVDASRARRAVVLPLGVDGEARVQRTAPYV